MFFQIEEDHIRFDAVRDTYGVLMIPAKFNDAARRCAELLRREITCVEGNDDYVYFYLDGDDIDYEDAENVEAEVKYEFANRG